MNRLVAVTVMTAVLSSGAEPYREIYRPQYHFSPKLNWTNDPCGIVYSNGEYHLFFQFNPFGDLWGHMSWGHAVSRDLIRWDQLPVAIPEGDDAMIFTGSSVVDTHNTSGLCKPGTSCILSIYTGHSPKTNTHPQRQAQHLAASQDGRTWVKYQGNPVLDIGLTDFRDPKVFWHEPSKQWVMVVVLPQEKKASLYGSPNLKKWKHLSDFGPAGATGGVWECPDLFELPVDGAAGKSRWVLKIGLNPGHIAGGSGEQYFIGQFDGTKFQNDNPAAETKWLDYGRDCYCALTWNGESAPQGRHMIGWMNNWQYARATPTSPWRGAMTLPRTLGLHNSPTGIRLTQTPAPATRSLRAEEFSFSGTQTGELNRKLTQWPHRTQTFELETVIRRGTAQRLTWKLLEGPGEYTLVGYDAASKQLFVDRTKSGRADFSATYPSRTVAPLDLGTGPLKLHIFVDRSSVEVFSDDGQLAITNLVFPQPENSGISLQVEGGDANGLKVHLWNLHSIWNGAKE
jgi:fructan beta-fructosidase